MGQQYQCLCDRCGSTVPLTRTWRRPSELAPWMPKYDAVDYPDHDVTNEYRLGHPEPVVYVSDCRKP